MEYWRRWIELPEHDAKGHAAQRLEFDRHAIPQCRLLAIAYGLPVALSAGAVWP